MKNETFKRISAKFLIVKRLILKNLRLFFKGISIRFKGLNEAFKENLYSTIYRLEHLNIYKLISLNKSRKRLSLSSKKRSKGDKNGIRKRE
jgi:hypothetical protein